MRKLEDARWAWAEQILVMWYFFPLVLWHCFWATGPLKKLVCWWWWFYWSFAHLTVPVVTTASLHHVSYNKIQNGDWRHCGTGLPLLPWKMAVKQLLLQLWFSCLWDLGTVSWATGRASGLKKWQNEHLKQFWMSPWPPPPYLATAKFRLVWQVDFK